MVHRRNGGSRRQCASDSVADSILVQCFGMDARDALPGISCHQGHCFLKEPSRRLGLSMFGQACNPQAIRLVDETSVLHSSCSQNGKQLLLRRPPRPSATLLVIGTAAGRAFPRSLQQPEITSCHRWESRLCPGCRVPSPGKFSACLDPGPFGKRYPRN